MKRRPTGSQSRLARIEGLRRIAVVVFGVLIVASVAVAGVSLSGRLGGPSPEQSRTADPSPTATSKPTPTTTPTSTASTTTPPDARPAGHELATWAKTHGKQSNQTCAVCHPPAKCSECHGLDIPHPNTWLGVHGGESLAKKATCAKCHNQITFCEACHAKLAHGIGWFAKHGVESKAGGATCLNCHTAAKNNSCEKCHAKNVHPSTWQSDHGKKALAANANCVTCHQSQTKFCTACHGFVMPHASDWNTAHRPAARADVTKCQKCHTKQDCATCHKLDQVSSCKKCHEAEAAEIGKSPPHFESQCLTCHKQSSKAIGPSTGHMTKNPDCFQCHVKDDYFSAQKSNAPRDWLKVSGSGPATWAPRQKHSPTDTNCTNCHGIHDASVRKFPAGTDTKSSNCAPACHSRLDTNVVSAGFTNASGNPEQTTYRGTIDPRTLISGSSTKHKTVVLAQNGCASKCHNGPHGTVTMCVSCHSYKYSDSSNLHSTHIPFVSAEQQQTDPENFEAGSSSSACKYCHKGGDKGVPAGNTVYKPGCWNCHLSGHNPITPYWELPS